MFSLGLCFCSGGSRGVRPSRPSLSVHFFHFMQFAAKIMLNDRLAPSPTSGKSWIRHCFVHFDQITFSP